MKNYNHIFLAAFFGFLFVYQGYAQEKSKKEDKDNKALLKKAEAEFDKFSYVKTSEILLEVANKGYKSESMFRELGDAFYFNNKMEQAAKWYGELFKMNENQDDSEYYFRYAQALKWMENYTESDMWMTKFFQTNKQDIRARAFAGREDYLQKITAIKNNETLHNLNINTELSDFGSALINGNTLVFASTRAMSGGDNSKSNLYGWNQQPFLDLYSATKTTDIGYAKVVPFDKNINTQYHESSVAYMPQGNVLFFTRNNYFKNKLKTDSEGTSKLQLYHAKKQDDGSWGHIESVHFNNKAYSVAHPTINAKGNKLYFVSDMPGTAGASDLYVANINPDGTLGEPVNLGKAINTESNETFPFISPEGDLFYSSNGLPGLGGLDVYVIRDFERKYELHQPLAAQNLGRPFNSPQDDFAYYENKSENIGFLSSNRSGGKGDDDIYSFAVYCKQEIKGVVKNTKTNKLLPFSTVTLYDEEDNVIAQTQVGDDAAFYFEILCDKAYRVKGEKEGYTSDEKHFKTPETDKRYNLELDLNITIDLALTPEVSPFNVGDDIRHILGIQIIYFDFDKDNIRQPDATADLQKVIAFMRQYPSVHIDVRSHTDSRGTFAYNADLSARRNKSTIDYIVNEGGISRLRLTGRGYGETTPVNHCVEGVWCSEPDHQLNRRSEFIVTQK
ncbi:MAG: OmpA family protein [Flavobacteriaceae bacterium]